MVLGPPVHALLVLLLLVPARHLLPRPRQPGLHGDVGAVLHGDQRLLGLAPGRGGGRAPGLRGDEVVQVAEV